MKNESTAILREQLRIKEAELQHVKAEARKSEKKKEFILQLSKEKLQSGTSIEDALNYEEIQPVDSEVELESKETKKETDKLLSETKLKLDESEKEKKEIKLKLLKAIDFIKTKNNTPTKDNDSEETKTSGGMDPDKEEKVKKAIEVLNEKNSSLQEELETLKIAATENLARKEVLETEIARTKEIFSGESLEKKQEELKNTYEEKINNYKKVITEKNKILNDLKASLGSNSEDGSDSESGNEDGEDLKDKFKELISQKDEADEKYTNLKSNFDKKLKENLESRTEELNKTIKRLKNKKTSNDTQEDIEEGAPAWMATFADMVTLILCFFILMYAIASQNVSQFKAEILGTETKSIGVLELLDSMTIRKKLTDLTPKQPDSVISDIKAVTKEAPVDVEVTKDNIILRIPGQVLFEKGGADLRLEARPSLDSVINIANRYPDYKINIQGHTDDYPISTERFPSNWELSSARATAVLRYFIDKGAEPERMTATGYADTFPLFSNDTKAGQLRNRRVEVILEKES